MILNAIDRLSKRLSIYLYNLSAYLTLPLLLFLVCFEVIMRYIFNTPLEWSSDVNGLLLLVTLFSALPHAWDSGYHIRMEIFYDRMPESKKKFSDLLSSLSGAIFFILLSIQSCLFSYYMYSISETGEDLNFHLWPFMSFIGICSFILFLRIISSPTGANTDNERSNRWT
ncbi:MAG: hypothetical protein CBC38_06970 [Gammaproteobacteria bacterium TMED78]|nr:MAG: hypothetical protein CBC38_06970 [Gammaproteobacteria bacterium TMED78]|tara:strand:+ start:4100 stop:4609 length:510 start_codon:yes stop_codon:yes gene_type:complete